MDVLRSYFQKHSAYQVMLDEAAAGFHLGTWWWLSPWPKRMKSHRVIGESCSRYLGLVWPSLHNDGVVVQSSNMVDVGSSFGSGIKDGAGEGI